MDTHSMKRRIEQVNQKINRACKSVHRNPEDVTLLLATKTVPPEKIARAVAAGSTLLGENKVQELREKHDYVENDLAEWHFIGHLQTNKINNVLPYVTCIQSVDRLKLAQKLHNRLARNNQTLDILIQVNTSYEASKFGADPDQLLDLIEQLTHFNTLQIKGLMTIGKLSGDPHETRKCFRLLKSLQQKVQEQHFKGVEMDTLSMGMSNDFETAIEEGATMVRVGTAIFGEREYPDSYYWNESEE